jgi:hypothetical protein
MPRPAKKVHQILALRDLTKAARDYAAALDDVATGMGGETRLALKERELEIAAMHFAEHMMENNANG